MAFDTQRVRHLNFGKAGEGQVVYWMSRDQRAADNHALTYAQDQALKLQRKLSVIFCLDPDYPGANFRHFTFMLDGLEMVEKSLRKLNIPLNILIGDPVEQISKYVSLNRVSVLATDFSPLKIKRKWIAGIMNKITVPLIEVDAHNIVPCWEASDKQEYGAYTLRPKIRRKLERYLEEFPGLVNMPGDNLEGKDIIDWVKFKKQFTVTSSVNSINWLKSGEDEAIKILDIFIRDKLPGYKNCKNHPEEECLSNLSPYLHFGHISAQRAALEINRNITEDNKESAEAFMEELVVRKELSDNFCYYNQDYDSVNGFPDWAKVTLDLHLKDKREYTYCQEELENAQTHDTVWNAAQMEMVKSGKMHGYMRMYWAKKILEWSPSYQEAYDSALYLNDKFELDGRDPNGYAGIAWSIGGVHDRPWFERPVFGKIRYMNENGLKKKFDLEKYIASVNKL